MHLDSLAGLHPIEDHNWAPNLSSSPSQMQSMSNPDHIGICWGSHPPLPLGQACQHQFHSRFKNSPEDWFQSLPALVLKQFCPAGILPGDMPVCFPDTLCQPLFHSGSSNDTGFRSRPLLSSDWEKLGLLGHKKACPTVPIQAESLTSVPLWIFKWPYKLAPTFLNCSLKAGLLIQETTVHIPIRGG